MLAYGLSLGKLSLNPGLVAAMESIFLLALEVEIFYLPWNSTQSPFAI